MASETTIAQPQQRPAPEGDGAATYLLCRVSRQLHAIPIEHVIEVMRMLPIEPVASAPSYVRGVSIVRGVPTPVVDTGLLTGGTETLARRLVEIKTEGRVIALVVEDVLGIRTLQSSRCGELPPLLRDVASETIAGIGTLDTSLLLILRLAKVVPEGFFEEIQEAAEASR